MTSKYMQEYKNILSRTKQEKSAIVDVVTDIDDIIYLLQTQSSCEEYSTYTSTSCNCQKIIPYNIKLKTVYTENDKKFEVIHKLCSPCYKLFLKQQSDRLSTKKMHAEIIRLLTLLVVNSDKKELEELVIHK
ncbi:MAG: hypothetical protein Edafosvirus2_32 [Edafosvirus sp.]|uniref:Uncharacterized protein n=1 Tax=Edafosvirus sp. TaxID=2487765 RepID=A0A3G4ZW64_9VIRU|nr:MAG: hypothetical protein Edafosvirus2_32 [Edafosvirus sp.]